MTILLRYLWPFGYSSFFVFSSKIAVDPVQVKSIAYRSTLLDAIEDRVNGIFMLRNAH